MSKAYLPPGWEVAVSKTHPDRAYYYNKRTGAISWVLPKVNEKKPREKSPAKSSKLGHNNPRPNVVPPSQAKSEKLKLVPKRTINKRVEVQGMSATMLRHNPFYREKMGQRNITDETQTGKRSTVSNIKETEFDTSKLGRPVLTPQARLLMLKRNINENEKRALGKQDALLNAIKAKDSLDPVNSKSGSTSYKEPKSTKRISRIPTGVPKADESKTVNTTVFKKNIAQRRMKNLKQKLALEIAKEKEAEREKKIESDISKKVPLHSLEWSSPISSLSQIVSQKMNQCLQKMTENVDDDNRVRKESCESIIDEQMDWEPIEEKLILTEVSEVRQQVFTCDNLEGNLPQNKFQLTSKQEKSRLYIIVDTNVFLIDLKRIEDLLNAEFRNHGRPFIIIPWTVIQELDVIKSSKSKPENLRASARAAISFLHQHFSNKHPRLLGQTAEDAYQYKDQFQTDNPDDIIWQTCLQIQNCHPNVILLTFDKNLQNKATIHGIKSLGRDSTLDMIDTLACDVDHSPVNHFLINKKNTSMSNSDVLKEALFAEDVYVKIEELICELMTKVLSVEAKNVFGDNWMKHMKIPPPWLADTALHCAEKHWIAITSEAFRHRKAESIIKRLLESLRRNERGLKLQNVSAILDNVNELIQMLKLEKYLNIVNHSLDQVDAIKKVCIEQEKKFNKWKFEQQIGNVRTQQEVEQRAKIGLQVFEQIYIYYRSGCDQLLANSGLRCPPISSENAAVKADLLSDEKQLDLKFLDSLLRLLKSALNDIGDQEVNHQTILQLHGALVTIPLVSNVKFEPLDIYCCLKHNEAQIRAGVIQYEEIFSQLMQLKVARKL